MSVRILLHSQSPELIIQPNKTENANAIFTLETSTFSFAQEGEANEYAATSASYRSHLPQAFMFENQTTNLFEICSHAMMVKVHVETGKSPTIVGFPSSPLSPEDDRTWAALKNITGGSDVYLWIPTTGEDYTYNSFRGIMSAINDVGSNVMHMWLTPPKDKRPRSSFSC